MPDIVVLAVVDLSRSRGFYCAALGVAPLIETPAYVEISGGIGLYLREGFVRNTGATLMLGPLGAATTATELYFRVADLSVACGRMEGAGARLLSPSGLRAWGEVVAYFADPDGDVIALAEAGSAQSHG
ncbi:MAG: hypothetical protein EXR69_08160 [Myxococcales bacterium]|nr:hypothetical protein [Myxococcales bacterium]